MAERELLFDPSGLTPSGPPLRGVLPPRAERAPVVEPG